MKLGFITAILDSWTYEEMMDFASEQGFECVEVACWPQEKAGYVTTYSAEYQGRKRKYYSITEEGKTQMVYLQGEWKSYRDTIDDIIEGRKKG